MNFRPATPDDFSAIEAFLADHIETSVFLVSNLRRFALITFAEGHTV